MNVSQFVRRLKSLSAQAILPALSPEVRTRFAMQRGLNQREFWQRGFRSFVVNDPPLFRQKVRYVHENPVRAKLVERPEDYRWVERADVGVGAVARGAGLEA